MKNHNIVKCFYCGNKIDTSKATTDKENEYVRFVVGNVYMHKNNCFENYEREIREEKSL